MKGSVKTDSRRTKRKYTMSLIINFLHANINQLENYNCGRNNGTESHEQL